VVGAAVVAVIEKLSSCTAVASLNELTEIEAARCKKVVRLDECNIGDVECGMKCTAAIAKYNTCRCEPIRYFDQEVSLVQRTALGLRRVNAELVLMCQRHDDAQSDEAKVVSARQNLDSSWHRHRCVLSNTFVFII